MFWSDVTERWRTAASGSKIEKFTLHPFLLKSVFEYKQKEYAVEE